MNELKTLENLCLKSIALIIHENHTLLEQLPNIEDKLRSNLSQEQQLKVWSTLYKEFDKNGKLKANIQCENNKKDGLSRYYNENNELKIIIEYQNGNRHFLWKLA